jgi:hypothetical protein
MNASNNFLKHGSVIKLNPISDVEWEPKEIVFKDSYFGNNTSLGPSSSIVINGFTPWLSFKFLGSTFMDNWGTITNDLYSQTFRKLEIIKSKWLQSATKNRNYFLPE